MVYITTGVAYLIWSIVHDDSDVGEMGAGAVHMGPVVPRQLASLRGPASRLIADWMEQRNKQMCHTEWMKQQIKLALYLKDFH